MDRWMDRWIERGDDYIPIASLKKRWDNDIGISLKAAAESKSL